MRKPSKCCPCGTHEHCVPMPILGRLQGIDFCIADIIAALNAANILTIASCCGHSKQAGNILLKDGRCLIIQKKKVKEG